MPMRNQRPLPGVWQVRGPPESPWIKSWKKKFKNGCSAGKLSAEMTSVGSVGPKSGVTSPCRHPSLLRGHQHTACGMWQGRNSSYTGSESEWKPLLSAELWVEPCLKVEKTWNIFLNGNIYKYILPLKYFTFCSPSSDLYPHPVTQQWWLSMTVCDVGGRHMGCTNGLSEEGQGFFSCSRAMS